MSFDSYDFFNLLTDVISVSLLLMRARGWGQCGELQRNNSDMGGRSRCLGKEAAEGVKHCNQLWEKSRWTNKKNPDFSTAPSKKCL